MSIHHLDPCRGPSYQPPATDKIAANIASLATEIVTEIFKYLDVRDAILLGQTCISFHQLQNTDALWRHFCVRDFANKIKNQQQNERNWKTYYQEIFYEQPENLFLTVAYPGKSTVFQRKPSTNWEPFYKGVPLIRKLKFTAIDSSAFVQWFSVLGYEKGQVGLFIQFSEDADKLRDYFTNLKIKKKDRRKLYLSDENRFSCEDSGVNYKLFRVLKKIIKFQ